MVKLVTAALQYVSTSPSAPAASPAPDTNVNCTCQNSSSNSSAAPTTVLASVTQSSASPLRNATTKAAVRNLRPCGSFGQQQRFPGSWQDSPDASYQGEYDFTLDCPKWINDYDCHRPPANAHIDPNLVRYLAMLWTLRCLCLHVGPVDCGPEAQPTREPCLRCMPGPMGASSLGGWLGPLRACALLQERVQEGVCPRQLRIAAI